VRKSSVVVSGRLAGVTFRFETGAGDLAAYACAHLAPLVAPAVPTPEVSATLTWHDGQPPAHRPPDPAQVAGLERVDRDIYTDGKRLCWFRVDDLRDLFLRFTWTEHRLTVHGDFYYRLGNSPFSDRVRQLRQWRRRGALRGRRFTTLLYYLVYYPCWWWLEQMRDLHPVHAAAVAMDAGVTLLAGASGVGKSTLAVALATTPGVRLLADSFVLHDGTAISGVQEPILLDAWSRHWLGDRMQNLQPIGGYFSLGRRGYQPPAHGAAGPGRAALLLFPRRSSQSYTRRISAEQARQRLSAGDLIINDLRRYWAFAAVLEQMAPAGLMAQREAHLQTLANTVPAYEIGISPDATSTAVIESIMQLAQDKQLRVASARP
jgi:hypothetical protein